MKTTDGESVSADGLIQNVLYFFIMRNGQVHEGRFKRLELRDRQLYCTIFITGSTQPSLAKKHRMLPWLDIEQAARA